MAAAAAPPVDDLAQQARRLQVLCLHGSRQDGEVFAQRVKTLRKKLKGIADLHFVSSPHVLPLQEGQAVPMRAWWRHWNISPADELQHDAERNQRGEQQQQCAEPPHAAPPRLLQPQPSLPHGKEREEEVSAMMAAGWEAVVLRDWSASLEHLCAVWAAGPPHPAPPQQAAAAGSSSAGSLSSMASSTASASTSGSAQLNNAAGGLLEFDGVLGFSNGAAAAFLFAAHAAAHPERFGSLRFVALAGGYVPEPLHRLLPARLLRPAGEQQGQAAPAERLAARLPFPSLHMMGSNDPLIDVVDSSQLMECFQEHGRVQLVHDSGHAVPQQSRWMQELLKFVLAFAELPSSLPLGHHRRRRPHKAAAAAAPQPPKVPGAGAGAGGAGAVVEAVAAEIEAKLHRQGLREGGVVKGPAHKHTLVRLDSTGQPHQHVDLLSPKALQSQRSRRLGEQPSGGAPEQLSQQRSFELQLGQQPPLAQNGQQQQQQQQEAQAEQQQRHEQAQLTAAVAPPAAPHSAADDASAAAAAPSAMATAATAAAAAAVELGEATEVQLEEIEALEAIFAREFHLVSSCPPTFTVKLREPEPLAEDSDEDGDDDEAAAAGPPSRLFALRFTLPKDYPASGQAALPRIDVEGPLGKNDPARAALAAHLAACAAEQQAELAGAGGYVWQLVGAAKEWIDERLPEDVGSRGRGHHAQAPEAAAAAATDAGAGAAEAGGGTGGMRWWEKEEVDLELVARATAEAAAARWRSWAVGDEDGPFCAEGGAAADGAPAAAAPSAADAADAAGDGSRGRWDYTVGLVGKPSAGKSTFFNAVTDPAREEDAAREAPFPFTTIAPNVGRGFVALPDPAPLLGLAEQAQPAFGYARAFDPAAVRREYSNVGPLLQLVRDCGWQQQQQQQQQQGGMLWRRVPVVVKDVAGLVPGAYQGRGRGNAFLNDLCDADVLVHVVDASGTTDSEGAGAAQGEGADPRQEVTWVRQELHCWVFDNVRAKWPGVLRRPSRLPQLFTGYHAPQSLVAAVLRRVGVRVEDLVAEVAAAGNAGLLGGTKETGLGSGTGSLAAWGEWELHRLVAHFLAARFPILLALNKADLPSAQQHIPAVLAAYPHDAAVAVSAAAERQLQQLRRAGLARYDDAAPAAAAAGGGDDGAAAVAAAALRRIEQGVLGLYGSTGVLAAITCAVALKPPRWAFPIADRETCAALAAVSSRAAAGGGGGGGGRGGHGGTGSAGTLGWGVDAKARAAQGAAAGVLRDCVLLKPGSRVEDVFLVLKRPPYGLLEGDFVRAECRVLAPGARQQHQQGAAAAEVAGQQQQQQQPAGQGGAGGGSGGGGGGGRATQCRVVRKDELVGPSNCVLLLQTNRKVSWQAGAGGKRHG